MPNTELLTEEAILQALQDVKDPEIPTVSLVDLGLITKVDIVGPDEVTISMTPTFSGCPALTVMRENVQKRVEEMGVDHVAVKIDLSVTWNTNMITEKGRRDIEKVGLSSPKTYCGELNLEAPPAATCPRCKSEKTAQISPFGPTLCRAIYYCNNCEETFEQFKPV
ncbi:MAG: phenylacetate-CoA oxygenase subunit PaaJ [Bacteroidetes bacterium]|nr:phenylacetate-CoA oxygenase subunit PaaJ [Bacteroidota bacterium]